MPAADVIGQLSDAVGVGLAQNVKVVNVIGFEGGICFEFAVPIAFFRLNRQKLVGAAFHRLLYAFRPIFLTPRYRGWCDRYFLTNTDKRGHSCSPKSKMSCGRKGNLASRRVLTSLLP